MTGPPTVPGMDLNPGPLSFETSALLTELTRPDKVYMSPCSQKFDKSRTSSIYFSGIDKNYYVMSSEKHMVWGNWHTLRKQSTCTMLRWWTNWHSHTQIREFIIWIANIPHRMSTKVSNSLSVPTSSSGKGMSKTCVFVDVQFRQ